MTPQTPPDLSNASKRLINDDLAPCEQNWNWYNIFSFWMSDVHSVGGYVFAASLFTLGLASWQILVSMLVGILVVQVFANLVSRPSQQTGVPFPVVCRQSFGIYGANIPAIIRGLIAVVWYGIQTYLAAHALMLVLLRYVPSLEGLTEVQYLGLSQLGWYCFLFMWVLQALVFWWGMNAVRRFIDFAGPAVYVVMFALAGWIVWQAGWDNISFTLGSKTLSGSDALWQMVIAAALVAGYFAGPTLNFGDFSRYCATPGDVKRGNFWGLPVNFLLFAVITVVVVSGTQPIFGEMLHDPMETVARIDNGVAAALGILTLVLATIGINIVANFVSPAFDFSNVAPSRISWRMGGMLAAVGSIFITPWNLFNNPEIIQYTVGILAAAIGPVYGVILFDHYLIHKGGINTRALFTDSAQGEYFFEKGVNVAAVKALLASSAVTLVISFLPLGDITHFTLFIGGLMAAGLYGIFSGYWLGDAASARIYVPAGSRGKVV
ncbi:NCS1 family nucleobase:cation symporter-1 [Cobetia marina]|uniref:NCS1 family nucleobase:cation symporter-1 n=1 Tax=Cobetia TaxID=204286 RepID=UPI0010AEC80A|nr:MULTISPECIES: NCS1 family nucleobase:cation symporter-1 [Cobetia]MDH2291608.1 NCS1 family nucleobase:cation symporter-1 [Cobetia sp. 10Alg 146]TKD61286.1 NCS1 family nucleobase:cation symporter-1 [Cobetia marina]GED42394.1 nitrate reductase [Cobetia marina]